MNSVIPFTKEIKFDNKICEITSISLEEKYDCTSDTIDGEFIISGEYKTHELSVNKEEFSYNLPFSVDLTENINPDTLSFEITDFSYDILNDNILKVNIEFKIDASIKEVVNDFTTDVEELLNDNDEMSRIDKKDEKTIIESIDSNDSEYMTYHVHIVKESDTIESICNMYKIDNNTLADYNDLNEFDIGKKLIIVSDE